jgi:hypothetical protein
MLFIYSLSASQFSLHVCSIQCRIMDGEWKATEGIIVACLKLLVQYPPLRTQENLVLVTLFIFKFWSFQMRNWSLEVLFATFDRRNKCLPVRNKCLAVMSVWVSVEWRVYGWVWGNSECIGECEIAMRVRMSVVQQWVYRIVWSTNDCIGECGVTTSVWVSVEYKVTASRSLEAADTLTRSSLVESKLIYQIKIVQRETFSLTRADVTCEKPSIQT